MLDLIQPYQALLFAQLRKFLCSTSQTFISPIVLIVTCKETVGYGNTAVLGRPV